MRVLVRLPMHNRRCGWEIPSLGLGSVLGLRRAFRHLGSVGGGPRWYSRLPLQTEVQSKYYTNIPPPHVTHVIPVCLPSFYYILPSPFADPSLGFLSAQRSGKRASKRNACRFRKRSSTSVMRSQVNRFIFLHSPPL